MDDRDEPDPPAVPLDRAIAAALGIALPPECIAGVAENGAILAAHWRNLRGFAAPDGSGY